MSLLREAFDVPVWGSEYTARSVPCDRILTDGELLDLGVKAGVVEKSGAWFSYGDERIGQGRENSKTFLKENPQVALEIEDKIRAAHGLDFHMDDNDSDDDLVEM